jgi:hypothetical protein
MTADTPQSSLEQPPWTKLAFAGELEDIIDTETWHGQSTEDRKSDLSSRVAATAA